MKKAYLIFSIIFFIINASYAALIYKLMGFIFSDSPVPGQRAVTALSASAIMAILGLISIGIIVRSLKDETKNIIVAKIITILNGLIILGSILWIIVSQ